MANKYLQLFEKFISDLRIISKEGSNDPRGSKLDLWESQRRFIREVGQGLDQDIHIFNCLKSRQQGICLHPDTRVLTADLRWIRIEDLKPGTEVISVDEYGEGTEESPSKHRKMRTGAVEAAIVVEHEAYKISFDDGRSVICTAQHPWLARKMSVSNMAWVSIEPRPPRSHNDPTRLRVGDQIRWITKPWASEPSYEDGWFGGVADGEGTMGTARENGASLSVHQRQNAVLERMSLYLDKNKYNYLIAWDDREQLPSSKLGRDPVAQLTIARQDELFRLLGTCRPSRFINNRFWEGRELPGKKSGIGWATITAIEKLEGKQKLIDLQTTYGTYIAEGFVSHNTTVSLAIDLFWLAMHDNMIAGLVCDNEQNKGANRNLLEFYVNSFDDNYFGGEFKIVAANRDQLKFSNGSRLDLLVAGVKKKSIAWAEGRGYTLLHITEIAKYADPDGVKSLLEGFAQKNPHRLLLVESTAMGYNHWRDRWYAGLRAVHTERSFFSGWWAVDTNRIDRNTPRFQKYNYDTTKEEREKIIQVKKLYGWSVTKEQLAWYRFKEDEAAGALDLLCQNNPWTADESFVQSGRSFFHVRTIAKQLGEMDRTLKQVGHDEERNPYLFKGYRYIAGDDFFSFTMEELEPSPDNLELVELRVWHEPVENARYCIGFDPAYGRTEHGDAHAIEVFRCYADRMVQVAEYRTADVDVRVASWVFFHLVAAYGHVMGNIDLQGGPGRQVMMEFDHLRQLLGAEIHQEKVKERHWRDAAANARWYLYHRPDSLGAGYCYNFETTGRNKVALMENMRSIHYMNEIDIRSKRLLQEMTRVLRDGDDIGAPDSAADDCKDDRTFATALACRAWVDWIRREMLAQGQTYKVVTDEENSPTPQLARSVNSIVHRFLMRQEELANKEPERGPRWFTSNGLI